MLLIYHLIHPHKQETPVHLCGSVKPRVNNGAFREYASPVSELQKCGF
jgi:hypothetical protein